MPEKCKYATLLDTGAELAVNCTRLTELMGYRCGVHQGWCELHLRAGGPDDDLEKGALLASWIKDLMQVRMRMGPLPKWEDPGWDLMAAAGKLKARCEKAELEVLVEEVVEAWLAVEEKDGGLTAEEVDAKAHAVARVWECEEALAAWAKEPI